MTNHQNLPIQKRLILFSIASLFFVVIDQLSKAAAQFYLAGGNVTFSNNFTTLSYVENPYGFLGILIDVPEPFRSNLLTFGVFVLLSLFAVFFLSRPKLATSTVILGATLFSGGTSNLLDRFIQQVGVIDFISFNFYFFSTGLCNLADIFIFIGGFGLGFLVCKNL